jgi:hypothetical protein
MTPLIEIAKWLILLYAVGEKIPNENSVPTVSTTFEMIDSADLTTPPLPIIDSSAQAIFDVFNTLNIVAYTVEDVEIALQHLSPEETLQLEEMLRENGYLDETEVFFFF